MRIVIHIDVNNAFLSWTAVKLLQEGSKVDIRDTCAVIGIDPNMHKGIVLAKSNRAKKLGVITGETLYMAKKKCRALRAYKPDYQLYEMMSNSFVELIKKYTPDVEQYSIDECFIEYTHIQHMYESPLVFAKMIQEEIYNTLGFTVNIGIGNNKLCAKMASEFSKPNKIHTCFNDEVKTKLWPLPVSELFGIGQKTSIKLKSLRINTIGQLANKDPLFLSRYFKNMAIQMINSANGIDDSIVEVDRELKGIGNEITLVNETKSRNLLNRHLLKLSEKVGMRIRKENKYAYTVCLVLKDNYFRRTTHQKKLINPINTSEDIYNNIKTIFNEVYKDQEIRLIGIRLGTLTREYNHQISIFDDNIIGNNKLQKTVDNLQDKYGVSIITRASLVKDKEQE